MFYNCLYNECFKNTHLYQSAGFSLNHYIFLENTHFAQFPSYPVSKGFFPVWFLAFLKQANNANVNDDANDFVKAKNHTGKKLLLERSAQGNDADYLAVFTFTRERFKVFS